MRYEDIKPGQRVRVNETCTKTDFRGKTGVVVATNSAITVWVEGIAEDRRWFRDSELDLISDPCPQCKQHHP
jgi:hypothetical protein